MYYLFIFYWFVKARGDISPNFPACPKDVPIHYRVLKITGRTRYRIFPHLTVLVIIFYTRRKCPKPVGVRFTGGKGKKWGADGLKDGERSVLCTAAETESGRDTELCGQFAVNHGRWQSHYSRWRHSFPRLPAPPSANAFLGYPTPVT